MVDTRFFNKKIETLTLAEITKISGAELSDENCKDKCVNGPAPLNQADGQTISFFDNKKYLDDFKSTLAGACFVRPAYVDQAPEGLACLITENPYMAYALTAQAFFAENQSDSGISDHACISASATIGHGVTVESGAVIKDNVKIGNQTHIGANTVIEDGVEIGEKCYIAPLCHLTHCLIGHGVRIAAGVKIGQAGFGFAISDRGYVSVPQLGRVILEDGVDIGANTTIDRGAINDTIIRRGTRIDNLVQLGHNVETGEMCVLVSQTGIAGSTKLGDFVMTGGQAGLAGHLNIASGAKIAAQSGIMRDINEPGEYMGSPAMPLRQYMRQVATLNKLTKSGKKGSKDNG